MNLQDTYGTTHGGGPAMPGYSGAEIKLPTAPTGSGGTGGTTNLNIPAPGGTTTPPLSLSSSLSSGTPSEVTYDEAMLRLQEPSATSGSTSALSSGAPVLSDVSTYLSSVEESSADMVATESTGQEEYHW
jgi:hypothetical protein